MKEPLELMNLMQNVNVEVDLQTNSTESKGHDLVDVHLSVFITGNIALPSNTWRGFSNNEDTGFLHLSLPGYYGELGNGGQMPSRPALLVLSCGSLWLYKPDKRLSIPHTEKPFDRLVKALDLGDEDTKNMLAYKKSPSSCILMDVDTTFLWLGTKRSYFCSKDASAMTNLREALSLQLKRFGDAATRWPTSCFAGPNGNPPTCLGNPDGTWFTQWSPIDSSTWTPERMPPTPDEVKSPRDQWMAAIDVLRSWRA